MFHLSYMDVSLFLCERKKTYTGYIVFFLPLASIWLSLVASVTTFYFILFFGFVFGQSILKKKGLKSIIWRTFVLSAMKSSHHMMWFDIRIGFDSHPSIISYFIFYIHFYVLKCGQSCINCGYMFEIVRVKRIFFLQGIAWLHSAKIKK